MNRSLLFLLSALLFAPLTLRAVRTEKWENDSFAEFSEGEAHGVVITSDGYLRIGPGPRKLASLPAEIVWAVAAPRPAKGESKAFPLYVAAGNEGQVFKAEADGKVAEFFKAAELQAQALAVDSDGNLYAGSMPNGKIYRVEPSGKSSVFFDPKEKYIWAMQFDVDGNLFVATGDKGKLYKVNRSGQGGVFYDSDETHLRSLLFDRQGRLWVGSDGAGLVYRFDPPKGATGTPFVAYDSDYREIKALVLASDGSVFVGAMGKGKSPSASSMPSMKMPGGGKSASGSMLSDSKKANATEPPSAAPSPDSKKEKKEAVGPKAEEMAVPSTSLAAMSIEIPSIEDLSSAESAPKSDAAEVVRISPDGAVEKWWTGGDEVYSLVIPEPGKVWVGTGSKGRLYELTAPRRFSVLGQLEAKTITALVGNGSNEWLAAASNGGAVWSLTAVPGRKGHYESKVFDARSSARWGAVHCTTVPGGGQVVVSTRSGNTGKPDKVWNDWLPLDNEGRVRSPTARYLQYKISLEWPGRAEGRPLMVDRVVLFYQPANQPPQVTRINILSSNVEIVKMPRPEMPLPPVQPNAGGAPNKKSGRGGGDDLLAALMQMPSLQQVKKPGWRSATWQASDPNEDKLRYDVFYRPAGSEAWKPLKTDLEEQFITWDAATWPDGNYYLKVVASDLPSNSEKDARSGEQISDLFTVDNTAPTIQADISAETLRKGVVSLAISDTTSVVDEVEISVDGQDWRPLLPVSGLFDSKTNRFVLPIDKLKDGDHYVVIRASDSANNVATQTVRFRK